MIVSFLDRKYFLIKRRVNSSVLIRNLTAIMFFLEYPVSVEAYFFKKNFRLVDIRLTQRKMAESENSSISSTGELEKNKKIYASDLYSKIQVDNLIKDPTYNTPSACVGYGLDILGGY